MARWRRRCSRAPEGRSLLCQDLLGLQGARKAPVEPFGASSKAPVLGTLHGGVWLCQARSFFDVSHAPRVLGTISRLISSLTPQNARRRVGPPVRESFCLLFAVCYWLQ